MTMSYLIASRGPTSMWDRGGPGAGAGTVDVYEFRGVFVSYGDASRHICETFTEAAKTSATTSIWVDFQKGRRT
jgi:hypothetical protein